MSIRRRTAAFAIVIITVLFTLQSCKKDDNKPGTPPAEELPKYIVYGNNNASAYMVGTNSLTEGTISTVGNGADVTKYEGIRAPNLIYKNGFFYWVDSDGGKFTKMKFEDNNLVIVKEIPFTTPTSAVGAYYWINDKTVFLGLWTHYITVDVDAMTILNGADFPIADSAGYGFEADAFVVSNGKLYLPYTYFNAAGYTEDTCRLAVMDFPAMTNVTYSKDARFDYPAGTNGSQQVIFEENGYIYVTCTSIFGNPALGTHSGILRVKVGETSYDPTYEIDLSTGEAAGASFVGLFYLGNGKAITKSTNNDFYAVDINAKTKTKINVPASVASFRGNVLVEDGIARIFCDSDYYVYTYNPADGSVTKGLKVEGMNFIQSLYKLR